MGRPTPTKLQGAQRDADELARLGGWLFKHRTALPVPLAVALLLIPPNWSSFSLSTSAALAGVPIIVAGECFRLWAVHHIGVISRTRSERLGPLIDTGPFSIVRNPLYLGNTVLWIGFSVAARLVWLTPFVVLLLALEYQAIVRWEERLLESRLGDRYRSYVARVPRWIPRLRGFARAETAAVFSWAETFYSERGTLIALAVGYALLSLKARVASN